MALNQSLQLKQSQSLVMTQQLQQSIKLLQLSSVDLAEFVNEEIEKNPLLAREEAEPQDNASETKETDSESKDSSERDALDMFGAKDTLDDAKDPLDTQEANHWEDGDQPEIANRLSAGSAEQTGLFSSKHGGGDGEYSLENTISSEVTLRDHLLEQLHVDVTDPAQRIIGSQLIDLLDESGYLRDDIHSLAETLGASEDDIEATIKRLQQFDPPGIFARNIQECLAIQLKDKDRYDPYMQRLVEHIELMGKGDIAKLQELCEVDAEDFADMLAEIRLLKPKPANDFIHDAAQAIVPEVFIRRGKKRDTWQIELNPDVLPKVLLNQTYYNELSAKSRRKDDKKYISEQMANASWLVKALDQRANTILKVSTEIVKQQEKFFLHGIQFLKPMTLKDIALSVELHESTISRVTSNKFMSTPRGIFELKYFFTSGISSTVSADNVSSKTVMFYIKELIDEEDPKKILSDDKIVKLLKEKDIDVARRTVAKYREAMHIPSSVVRRKQKNTPV